MKRWRCVNQYCEQTDFKAEKPICPQCQLDTSLPRYQGLVIELATIHFDPPDERYPLRGMNHLACNPSKGIAGFIVTGVHSVVNCEACQETEVFKATKPEGPVVVEEPVKG